MEENNIRSMLEPTGITRRGALRTGLVGLAVCLSGLSLESLRAAPLTGAGGAGSSGNADALRGRAARPPGSSQSADHRRIGGSGARVAPGFADLRVDLSGRALRPGIDYHLLPGGLLRLELAAGARTGDWLGLRYSDARGSLRRSRFLVG